MTRGGIHDCGFSVLRRIARLAATEKARFVLVGGWNTVASYLIFVAVHLLFGRRIGTAMTVTVSYAIALPLAFALQRYLVFTVKGSIPRQFLRFTLANSTIFVLNVTLLPLLVFITKTSPLLVQALFVAVSAVASYFAHKYYSFSM